MTFPVRFVDLGIPPEAGVHTRPEDGAMFMVDLELVREISEAGQDVLVRLSRVGDKPWLVHSRGA